MLKKINSRLQTKIFVDFNNENEKEHFITHEGCQNNHLGIDYASIETGLCVCVTERGNYILTSFSDLFSGYCNDIANGMGIETKESILLNGKKINESFRKKADYDTYFIIESDKGNAVIYPIKENDNELFVEYDKEKNYIGFINLINGKIEAKARNILKIGVCFSNENQFVRENAEPYLFESCSLAEAGC